LQYFLHLLFSLRKRDHHRYPPVRREAIALIGARVLLLPQDGALGHELSQPADHFALPGDVDAL
jgi:hypothetical protein